MGIYLSYILVLFITFGVVKELKIKKKDYTIFLGFLFFLILALKSSTVGIDIKQYIYRYSILNIRKINLNGEFGFELYQLFFKKLHISAELYLAITYFFITVSFFRFFYKYSKNIVMSIYLHITIGMFTMIMSGIRQSLTIAISLWMFDFIFERKKYKYYLCCLIGYTIHTSMIAMLPIYFINKIKLNKKLIKLVYVFLFLLVLGQKYILKFSQIIVPIRYSKRYDLLNSDYTASFKVVLVYLSISLFGLYLFKLSEKLSLKDRKIHLLLTIYSVIAGFIYILSLNSVILGRIAFYFIPANAVLIPNILTLIKEKNIRLFMGTAIVSLSLIMFILGTIDGTLQIDNYRFFFFDN